ncbi:MAG: M24 family metallopeptidase [Actinomycetota bacterium]
MDHAGRRERLRARLPELGVEAMLVTRLVNVRYLTGFTGSNGQLVLTESEDVFFTDSRYEEQARRQLPDVAREVYPRSFPKAFAGTCREAGLRRVAFEAAEVTVHTHRELTESLEGELVPTEDQVERLRWVKEPPELELIARAQSITDEAFDRLTAKLAGGMTERQAAFELELVMREAGAERLAFESIVAFGENAAEPHHGPGDRELRGGDVVKLDFGCVVDGYHSDMTRTVAFGEPPPELREVHEVVARAQRAGVEAVRPGTVGSEADRAARDVIDEAGYGDRFGHSLGHGVGLEIHEGPTLRRESSDVLPEGTVVTVEPGVYLPGVGGVRIEDMVVVEADGCRVLPRSTRELVVLEP